MQHILIYSDSISWGIIPDSRNRLPFDRRWPDVFENALNSKGYNVRVIENCLNGRRTTREDPFKEGRNGSQGLAQVIEMHSPLKLAIIMLGTNDFQNTHDNNAWLSAQGIAKLINIIRQAPLEPGMDSPEIMIIAPPVITKPQGIIAKKFESSAKRCVGIVSELNKVAKEYAVHYFNAGSVTESSVVDGIHLDDNQHQALGVAIADAVSKMIIF